jgi:metallo-beta-lactamase class B
MNMVYADSLTPVSADGFGFSNGREHPNAVADFERSYRFLETTACDILITPHPSFSNLWERLAERRSKADALIDPAACRALAASSRESLKMRLAEEAKGRSD